MNGPSTYSSANAPYCLGCLRTTIIGRPVICETAVAMITPPSSVPPITSGLISETTGANSRAIRRRIVRVG